MTGSIKMTAELQTALVRLRDASAAVRANPQAWPERTKGQRAANARGAGPWQNQQSAFSALRAIVDPESDPEGEYSPEEMEGRAEEAEWHRLQQSLHRD